MPLTRAAPPHGADCVAVLSRAGCDMTAKTTGGRTGKQLAERQGHKAVRVHAEPDASASAANH